MAMWCAWASGTRAAATSWKNINYLKGINLGSSRVRDGVLIDAIDATAHLDAIAATSNYIATPLLTQARKISRITVPRRTSCTLPRIT
jgi:hypothetical protein